MAIELENKPFTIAPNADYPFGDIQNRVGATPGTPGSREVYADFHQFFAWILDNSEVTPNNLPDNQTNGFQLVDALNDFVLMKKIELNLKIDFNGAAAPTIKNFHSRGVNFASITRTATGVYTLTFDSNLSKYIAGVYSINDIWLIHSQLVIDVETGDVLYNKISPFEVVTSTSFRIRNLEFNSATGSTPRDLNENDVDIKIEIFQNVAADPF